MAVYKHSNCKYITSQVSDLELYENTPLVQVLIKVMQKPIPQLTET